MQGTKLTIKDKSASPARLANFLKNYIKSSFSEYSVHYYLKLAKDIIDGKEYKSDVDLGIPENEFVHVELYDIFSESANAYAKILVDREYYNDLIEKGANGDAQAAIEFCKAVKDGKYNNIPFA